MSVVVFDKEPLAAILDAARTNTRFALGPANRGFGGVHGGLALAMLTRAMQARASGVLRRVSGDFRRALRGEFDLEVGEDHAGSTVRWLSARANQGGVASLAASAVFATSGPNEALPVTRGMPDAPPPSACPVFAVPLELVPFAWRTEVRPVGAARPYASGARAELMAWVRIIEDDAPPDEARLVMLMDALAPSYAALLHAPAPIPTVTLSVALGDLGASTSPWILLRATTGLGSRDGWLHETLDAWTPDGDHLASAEQLRVVLGTAGGRSTSRAPGSEP